jgi:hypothetical protein
MIPKIFWGRGEGVHRCKKVNSHLRGESSGTLATEQMEDADRACPVLAEAPSEAEEEAEGSARATRACSHTSRPRGHLLRTEN